MLKERLLFLSGGGESGGPGGTPPGGTPPSPGAQEWFTGLPDTLKGDASVFEPFKDKPVTEVLTAYRDLSKSHAEFAIPASAKEYGVEIPKELPQGVSIDPDAFDAFLQEAHAAGVPKKSVEAMVKGQIEKATAAAAEAKKARDGAETALRGRWGAKYDENFALAAREIKSLPKDMLEIIDKAGLGNHPHLLELIYTVATAKREGGLPHGGDPGAGAKPLSERLYG